MWKISNEFLCDPGSLIFSSWSHLKWVLRLNSTRARCVANWSELQWVQSAPNLTYSYKNCETTKRRILMTSIGHDPEDFDCYPACQATVYKLKLSSLKSRSNTTVLHIEYAPSFMVFEETRKMTIVDVLSLIGGGTSLFLGCSCVTLMETFVFLFKLVVQGITKDSTEETTEKPAQLERIGTVDSTAAVMSTGTQKTDSRFRRKSTLVHIYKGKRLEKKEPEQPMAVDNSTNPTDVTAKTQILGRGQLDSAVSRQPPNGSSKTPDDEENVSKVNEPLGERIFTRLKRQPALDVPDEIGDHNLRVQTQTSFILDDFTSARGSRGILRRASTATSKASNTSRARSLKVLGQVPQKRKSQIFSKHLLMNDF